MIERADAIGGWMSREELSWLAAMAATHHNIAEVGSWKGRSTAAIADNTSGIVYAIDTWRGSDEPAHHAELDDKDPEWLFGEFEKNRAPNVIAIRGTSLEAAEMFAQQGKTFDMIFIDGAHDVESVKADIRAWRPLLADGGLLCGHDYFTTVQEAVDSLLVVRPGGGSIWVFVSDR